MQNVDEHRLSAVMDIKVQLTVRLGSTQKSMRDVLEIAPGSVVKLDQPSKSPVGVYINDKLIALGEVVVVEDNFAIKISSLVGDVVE
jgi:flagellar motor switch protein FliN/FliY